MKKYLFVAVIFLMLFTLSSCKHVEDTNGEEDYTIETFSDEDIFKNSSNYLAIGKVEKNINNESSLSVSKFSGIYKFTSFKVKDSNFKFKIESNCSSGNFKIVLVKDNNTIINIEINNEEIIEINEQGTYALKVIGESAKFSLKIIRM